MNQFRIAGLALVGTLTLAACSQEPGRVDRKLQDVNVLDETNLSDIMLTAADPDEAVRYFRRSLESQPGRIDFRRGLARSLVRAGRPGEAVAAWQSVTELPDSGDEDKVMLADALVRAGNWDEAASVMATIPPGHESYDRYRIEAMLADVSGDWDSADIFYQSALAKAPRPANVLNNWGFSKLSRGDAVGAEALFTRAVRADPTLFRAKNNLMLARGAQGKYSVPVIPMTQVERAELLYTLGLAAAKRGDVTIAKGLFRDALETHPQYFEAAATSLRALDETAVN